MPLPLLATAIAAYLLGGCVTGYYLVHWRRGEDIRDLGSGSAGARNVGRILGKAGFFATLAGDCGKGLLAVAGARWLAGEAAAPVAMLAVVAGHLWPVQLRLRGGKGMATALGAIIALDWITALFSLCATVAILVVTRRSLVAGLCGVLLTPVVAAFLSRPLAETIALALLPPVIFWSHRENLRQMFAASEGAVPDRHI